VFAEELVVPLTAAPPSSDHGGNAPPTASALASKYPEGIRRGDRG
jgi:hypothetical protein